jgi:Restriction endonuclease
LEYPVRPGRVTHQHIVGQSQVIFEKAVTTPLPPFQVGQLYSNEDISAVLGVGNAGGIRPNLNEDGTVRRLVLMTAIPDAKVVSENPYHDRIEGGVLIYTGTGLQGDQEPTGLNRRLVEQSQGRFPIWCFRQEFSRRNKLAGKNRWRFLGLLLLLRHYRERQVDVTGTIRAAWVFELAVVPEPLDLGVDDDTQVMADIFSRPAIAGDVDQSPIVPEPLVDDTVETNLEQLRRRMLALDPRAFELLIRRALEASGYEAVAVTRYSQDGGIDVNAAFGPTGWPVRSCRVQIQAKRWLHTVGRKEVAELRGSLQADGIGCLITTSHFSRAALGEAAEAGKSPITLVNGRQFAALLSSLNIDPLA